MIFFSSFLLVFFLFTLHSPRTVCRSVFSVEYLYHCSMIALCTPFLCTLTFWAHFSFVCKWWWWWGAVYQWIWILWWINKLSKLLNWLWLLDAVAAAAIAAIVTICLECIYKRICGCLILFCSQLGWVAGFQFLSYFCSLEQHIYTCVTWFDL